MVDTTRLPSSTVWLNSAHIEDWLGDLWPSWRMGDVRHGWDDQRRWYWVIPDFDRGRSRVLGIPRELLETTTVTKLREVLDRHDWLKRIDSEPLLVERDVEGEWTVRAWDPVVEEAWFPAPEGGYFVAFRTQTSGVHVGLQPARLPEAFLAIHGKAWSAMGPRDPREPGTYDLEELRPYLPKGLAAT